MMDWFRRGAELDKLAAWMLAVEAMRDGRCSACGGGGYVADHEMVCPVETLIKEHNMHIDKGPCRSCGKDFETNYYGGRPIVSGECSKCYMDRSRGEKFVTRRAREVVRLAKVAKRDGELRAAKRHARDAKRLLQIARLSGWA